MNRIVVVPLWTYSYLKCPFYLQCRIEGLAAKDPGPPLPSEILSNHLSVGQHLLFLGSSNLNPDHSVLLHLLVQLETAILQLLSGLSVLFSPTLQSLSLQSLSLEPPFGST